MISMSRAAVIAGAIITVAATSTTAISPAGASGHQDRADHHRTAQGSHATGQLPGGYKHLVVIYEENHSFDNLYGSWGSVNGQHVEGLSDAKPSRTTQVAQDGNPYGCLPQNDVNLTSPPLSNTCQDAAHNVTASHFTNQPFSIDSYIGPADKTCAPEGTSAPATGVPRNSPGAVEGGCTRDLVHRFYQEQYQIHGGKQDRYTNGSDAWGLTQGVYDTQALPIYRYLHGTNAPNYVIADHFFQAAFGGSFLNHQWLIAARSPLDTDPAATYTAGGPPAKNSVLDDNGMPTSYAPQYTATKPVVDDRLTRECKDPAANHYRKACGDFAVNTIQPGSAPHASGPYLPLIDDAKYPNIGDRLSDAGISWNWYSGGWNAAKNGSPGALFQYHHQPFNYFADYAPNTPGREHLRDDTEFDTAAQNGTLPTVSFVKPYGAENEHPGYTSEPKGSDHLVELLQEITEGPQARDTLVVVTYDEFGGQWDHVSPPKADRWGPGTRIPALVIGGRFEQSGVDHTSYDTTSILATIEHSFGLEPLSSRDAHVRDLDRAVAVGHD